MRVNNHYTMYLSSSFRHVRLWCRVCAAGGSECDWRHRREGPVEGPDRRQPAAADLGSRIGDDQQHRAAKHWRAGLCSRKAAGTDWSEDEGLRQRVRLRARGLSGSGARAGRRRRACRL